MAMQDLDVVLTVSDDKAVQTWSAQVLGETSRLEVVGATDLVRVLRMVESTGSQLVLVDVPDAEVEAALSTVRALINAHPWVTVVTLVRHPDQQLLLQCMRAGARDCLVVGGDGGEARERLREHQQVTHMTEGRRVSRAHNLILVGTANMAVNTTLLSQELAMAINYCQPETRLLAIDLASQDQRTFYLESHSGLSLSQLMQNPDALDEAMIDTALPEYKRNLRLISGNLTREQLASSDSNADLFIALSRMMDMFDTIVVNIGYCTEPGWVKTLGIHVRHMLFALNPQVNQVQATRELAAEFKPFLGKVSEVALLLDGVEPSVPPNAEEVAQSCGLPVMGQLPMSWPQRLEAMNLGLSLQELAPRNPLSLQMQNLAYEVMGLAPPAQNWWQRLNLGSR